MAEEADKNARAYLRKFEEFHGPLEDGLDVVLEKFGKVGVKKIWFTGEGLPLFPKLSPQQLHEIFVKNPASTDQCSCLEEVANLYFFVTGGSTKKSSELVNTALD